jgi:oxygen-independent coproporphyrinogen-3 oxidase
LSFFISRQRLPAIPPDRAWIIRAGSTPAEALFTGLRLAAGIDERNFRERYGVDPWSRHEAALAPLVGDGLVWRQAGRFGLTRRGMLVANEILVMFV